MSLYNRVYIFLFLGALSCVTAGSVTSCSYSFTIPGSDCSVAPDILNQLTLLQAVVQNQQSQLELLTDRIMAIETPEPANNTQTPISGVGSTYVRWGRTVCPDTAQLIYKGYAGKAHYNNGGGVDYQCLPEDPEWPAGATAGHQSQSYMYGCEYELHNSPVWPSSIHDDGVPCAVCSVNERTRQIMIPAKLTCPDDWTNEYSGVLAAEHYTHKGSTFVCVDSDMR